MSRNFIIAMGALLWTAFAVDAIAHSVTGDWIAPAIAGLVGLLYVALRRVQISLPEGF